MGCTQSKIENENSVIRCRNRNEFMRDAVASRNAFAAAQASYAFALKNTGAALSDFAHSVLHDSAPSQSSSSTVAACPSSSSAVASAVVIKPPESKLPLPPPPPPSDSSFVALLQRAASMHAEFAIPKPNKKVPGKTPVDTSILEENEDERADDERSAIGSPSPAHARSSQSRQAPLASPPQAAAKSETWDYLFGLNDNMMLPTPKGTWTETREGEREEGIKVSTAAAPPPKMIDDETSVTPAKVVNEPPPTEMKQVKKIKQSVAVDHQHVFSAGASEMKKNKSVATNLNLIQIFVDLDDHFLRAWESSQEVSKMLEAPRLHYHSNFADNRGHLDHSAMLMRVITWNRSFKGISQADNRKDDFEKDELETHASILDKMLAWERKLYDEVKAEELMKIEYKKKLAMLNKQTKHGGNLRALEATKSAVSHLHTRYVVDMQLMDSTISEINNLRDHQLYHKLGELVKGMDKMWKTIYFHHSCQFKLTKDFRYIDIQLAPRETSEQHYNRTIQLRNMVGDWDSRFDILINHQKDYIKFLNSWLNVNLVQVEQSGKEMPSPQQQHDPPIQALLHEWQDQLENLPDSHAKSVLSTFSGEMHAVALLQVEELNLKLKWDDAHRDFERKRRDFEEWHLKYMERTSASSNELNSKSNEGAYQQEYMTKRKIIVTLRKFKLSNHHYYI